MVPKTNGKNPKDEKNLEFSSRTMMESFTHAWDGLSYTYKSQRNMRIHIVMGALVLLGSIGAGLSTYEFLMVFLAVAVVLSSEVVNTLSESIVDLLEPDFSLLAKRVKDVAAGGVLLGAVFSVVIGVVAFYPAVADFHNRLEAFFSYRWKYALVYSFFVLAPAVFGALYFELGRNRDKSLRLKTESGGSSKTSGRVSSANDHGRSFS